MLRKSEATVTHAQATNLRFNWIIIIELYNVRNMPGKALKWGTLVKNRAANGKIPKTAISIRTRYI